MANTVEPLVSPEEPPAASYATDRRSSPACLADTRVLPVSVAAEAGAQLGPLAPLSGPRLCARGPPCLTGPAPQFLFSYLFCLFVFTDLCA